MKYVAMANSHLYNCGYHWVVVDENYNVISEHVNRAGAELEAERLNKK